jgi:hypothetical protein
MGAIEEAAEAVANAPAEAVTAAVLTSQAAPAPSDPLEQRMQSIEATMASLQPLLPLVNTLANLASAEIPSIAPVVSRIEGLEGFASDLVAVISSHFGGKVALPAAPSRATPAA